MNHINHAFKSDKQLEYYVNIINNIYLVEIQWLNKRCKGEMNRLMIIPNIVVQ